MSAAITIRDAAFVSATRANATSHCVTNDGDSAIDILEPLFRRFAVAGGRPWPSDPQKRASARLIAVQGAIARRRDELEAIESELAHVIDRAEATRAELDDWLVVAEELARQVGRSSTEVAA